MNATRYLPMSAAALVLATLAFSDAAQAKCADRVRVGVTLPISTSASQAKRQAISRWESVVTERLGATYASWGNAKGTSISQRKLTRNGQPALGVTAKGRPCG